MNKNEALKMAIECLKYHYKKGAWGCDLEGTIYNCEKALNNCLWQNLTNNEIQEIDDVTLGDYYVKKQATDFARAIEQALKNKNL